jgi:hypothetical protein
LNRLPLAAFVTLAVATVGAFFVTQHLKVSTPLIAGAPKPFPAVISPAGNGCGGTRRVARFSFYLLHRADDVAVYIVDGNGTIVRTLASGRHMRRGVRTPDGQFPWNGREDNGRVAPDGAYYYRVALLHQNRTVEYTRTPVTVRSTPPQPVVTSVHPSLIPQGSEPVQIRYRGNEHRGGVMRLYRTDLPGPLRAVKSFRTPWKGQQATWDGKINRHPAPAGTYLVGLDVTDAACNTGRFPSELPPARGTTAHAGVTVRYLAAQPPLDPVPAGSSTTVYVDARRQPYSWKLHQVGHRRVVAHGNSRAFVLNLRAPSTGAGLYVLALRSAAHKTAVPIVVSAAHPTPAKRPLVILPALTWQGLNPVDDNGDGLPDTLSAGGPAVLRRPLADGLPAGFSDEADLLVHLDRAHLAYDLTTDLGLIDGVGPALRSHHAAVLGGTELWVPGSLGAGLRAYVQQGGHMVSIGVDSLRRGVTLRSGRAVAPSAPAAADVFGVRPGTIVAHTHDLITVIRDGLGVFSSTSGALPGFTSYGILGPGSQPFASEAGITDHSVAVAGVKLGHGTVVEIALPGFGSELARNVDAQELIGRLWQLYGR